MWWLARLSTDRNNRYTLVYRIKPLAWNAQSMLSARSCVWVLDRRLCSERSLLNDAYSVVVVIVVFIIVILLLLKFYPCTHRACALRAYSLCWWPVCSIAVHTRMTRKQCAHMLLLLLQNAGRRAVQLKRIAHIIVVSFVRLPGRGARTCIRNWCRHTLNPYGMVCLSRYKRENVSTARTNIWTLHYSNYEYTGAYMHIYEGIEYNV